MTKSIFIAFLVFLLPLLSFAQSINTELVVKGRILDYQGQPVAGASVTVGPVGTLKGGRVPMTTSNQSGDFSVVVHQTGDFLVTAKKLGDNYPSTNNSFYYPYPDTLALVTVIANQPAPFATVRFAPKAGKLLMHVLDADTNQPVKEIDISLCRIEAPKYCHRFADKSAMGQFSSLVPTAPFTIQISTAGYEDSYGGSSSEQGLQALQVPSETTRELTVSMHKLSGSSFGSLLAPKIVSPVDGTVLLNVAHPRMLTVEWSAVPDAATYTVEVEVCDWEKPDGGECKTGTHPLTLWREPPPSGIEGTSYEFMFPGTQPGRWRVWAVDAKGRPGVKTPWTIFFYKWTGPTSSISSKQTVGGN